MPAPHDHADSNSHDHPETQLRLQHRADTHPEPDAGKEIHRSGGFPSPRVARDVALTRATRANDGVIPLARLHRLGFTDREIEGLVAHGDLRRVHRGVYADGRTQLSDRGRLQAALLALGRGAWLPGETGAAAWGLKAGVPAQIEVALCADHTPRHPGLTVKRVVHPPHPSEIRLRRGLRVSSISRLLIESAATGATTDQLHALVEAAARRNLLDTAELAATLVRNAGRRGTAHVSSACQAYLPSPGRKSLFEQSFDRWLAKNPQIPQPQRNIHLGQWEIDCYWPAARLALELDGREFHIAAADFERDRLKDAWLQRNAIRILRVSWQRWHNDRQGAQDDLTSMLAPASWQPSPDQPAGHDQPARRRSA